MLHNKKILYCKKIQVAQLKGKKTPKSNYVYLLRSVMTLECEGVLLIPVAKCALCHGSQFGFIQRQHPDCSSDPFGIHPAWAEHHFRSCSWCRCKLFGCTSDPRQGVMKVPKVSTMDSSQGSCTTHWAAALSGLSQELLQQGEVGAELGFVQPLKNLIGDGGSVSFCPLS